MLILKKGEAGTCDTDHSRDNIESSSRAGLGSYWLLQGLMLEVERM